MKIRCKKCGAEYGVFDLSYNGNGDGTTFISCDYCDAITPINIPDLYHGWNPNDDNMVVMECIDDIKDTMEDGDELVLKWLTEEEADSEGFFPFVKRNGTLRPYIKMWDLIFDEYTFKKDVDFNRCLKECDISVDWNGHKPLC